MKISIKDDGGLVFGDPIQLQQVVMNLGNNAAHAMRRKGGTLEVEVSALDVVPAETNHRGLKAGPYALLRVTDTGEGMSEDVLEKMYDPFFTTKSQGEGTGLGLSVVHGIVKESDGYIEAQTTPGEGTTFRLYFPRMLEDGAEREDEEDIDLRGRERILFVDDEEAIAEMAREMLAGFGYLVESRTSPREALAVLRLDPRAFDLVMTDQTMPEMTGMELAREALVIRPDIPVILCTGYSQTVSEESARGEGIKGFVMKRLTRSEVARTIRKVLDGGG
jgi:CheY-like chemotaxis protein